MQVVTERMRAPQTRRIGLSLVSDGLPSQVPLNFGFRFAQQLKCLFHLFPRLDNRARRIRVTPVIDGFLCLAEGRACTPQQRHEPVVERHWIAALP